MSKQQPVTIRDRAGIPIADSCEKQGKLLAWLYGSSIGQNALRILTKPLVSDVVGELLEHPLSTAAIPFFVKSKQIPMQDYLPEKYRSFNAFFTRTARPGARPVNQSPELLVSPCDAKLTVLPITEGLRFTVKGTEYALPRFLGCKKLANRFAGGWCMIFRLTPDDYHRYCYPDDARVGTTRYIEGMLHTVNPVSSDYVKVYHENTRTITMLCTEHFGHMLQIEVGAMPVGRIVNHPHTPEVKRGEEKGYFAFGGSTVVLLAEADTIAPDAQILKNSEEHCETIVRYGEPIASSLSHT